MAKPRTSIIMPVYNTEKSVVRAIESVLAQTDPDFELLILNDQSPDNSDAIIQNYLAKIKDSRISYSVNPKNLGLAGTRNRGISMTNGDWLAFLDSDDAFKPKFLETMHRATDNNIDVVVCAHDVVYEDGRTRKREQNLPGLYTGKDAMLALMQDKMTPFAWDKIFRRSAMGDLLFPLVNRTEDAGYSIPAYQRSRYVRVINETLHFYSVNPLSITWGSVPPISEMYKFVNYLKEITDAHMGSEDEQDAMAASWTLTFLNGAQSALRLQPDDLSDYLNQCRQALNSYIIVRTWKVRPVFGAAATLLKLSPTLYRLLYGAYVKRTYGL